jgi:hypothetical protein
MGEWMPMATTVNMTTAFKTPWISDAHAGPDGHCDRITEELSRKLAGVG